MRQDIEAVMRGKQGWILVSGSGLISLLLEDRNQMTTIPPGAYCLISGRAPPLVLGASFRSIVKFIQLFGVRDCSKQQFKVNARQSSQRNKQPAYHWRSEILHSSDHANLR